MEEEGLVYFDWNVTSKDASSYRLSSQAIVSNVLSGVGQSSNASVVLLHDASDKYTTVEALPEIIETLLQEDAVFLPITNGTAPVCHVVRSENDETEE